MKARLIVERGHAAEGTYAEVADRAAAEKQAKDLHAGKGNYRIEESR